MHVNRGAQCQCTYKKEKKKTCFSFHCSSFTHLSPPSPPAHPLRFALSLEKECKSSVEVFAELLQKLTPLNADSSKVQRSLLLPHVLATHSCVHPDNVNPPVCSTHYIPASCC